MHIFIVKPVGWRCNIRCQYCFYHECPLAQAGDQTLMTDDTLTHVIREGLAMNPRVAEFDWLGGEPLLAGLEFYQRVVELQSQFCAPHQRITNRVQTNGTLLDDRWVTFFAKHRFTVGLSMDGPAAINDRFRYDADGRGTTDQVLVALRLLRQHNVYHGVICVVNSLNVHHPDEVLEFFVRQGINRLAFNHAKGLFPDGRPLPTTVDPDDYARFMCRLFDRWLEKDDPNLVIRQFKSILHSLMGGRYRMCVLSNQCHTLFGIESDGTVYPCEDHPGEGWQSFGNVRDGAARLLAHPNRLTFKQKVDDAKRACQSCRWWNICQGGCPRDYYFGVASMGRHNRMCKAYRTLFEHIVSRIKPYLETTARPES